MQAQADLHVHSKYSNRPSEWILRRIGAPECFVEPADLYRHCRQHGMSFVTITDHNCIRGALEIADLPGTFVSVEITTYFPEDGCKIHCLAYGITESQFEDIQGLRENIYELRDYLLEQNVLHSIAHPLYAVNDRLRITHLEKLVVLFNRFEGINGTRHQRANELSRVLLTRLTPQVIDELATEHDIEPAGQHPWKKMLTGGSDDHSGVYAALTHTVTPPADTTDMFLEHLARGDHQPAGRGGGSLKLAHSLYHIAYHYYRDRFLIAGNQKASLLGGLLSKMVSDSAAEAAPPRNTVRGLARRAVTFWKTQRCTDTEKLLVREFARLEARASTPDRATASPAADNVSFDLASRISQELGCRFLEQFSERVREGSLFESIQSLASLGPVALSIAPYLAAFRAQHKDDHFLDDAARRFDVVPCGAAEDTRKAWITDTFAEDNSLSRRIATLARLALDEGRHLTVVTCHKDGTRHDGMRVMNFPPVGTFTLPEHTRQPLAFPPFLEIIQYLERERFSELLVSTPGPLGLVAIAAGRLLGVKLVGMYDVDFPKCVQVLTEDDSMAQTAWRYICWFYGQMDVVLVPTEAFKHQLVDNGLEPSRIRVLPSGVDTTTFSPRKRRPDTWQKWGCNGSFKFLCPASAAAGKNVRLVLDAFTEVRSRGGKSNLVILGDQSSLCSLHDGTANDPDIVFTGSLCGEERAEVYAGSDAFILPDNTGAFSEAVLEAQASGLPVIVAGGHTDSAARHEDESDVVTSANDRQELTAAMLRFVTDADHLKKKAGDALESVSRKQWQQTLDQLWKLPSAT